MKLTVVISTLAIRLAGVARADEALPVELTAVNFSSASYMYSVTGEIEAIDSVPIGAKESGRLLSIYVDVGDTVAAGQVLAELDPTQATEALHAAEAQLQATEATLKQAELAFDRATDLLKQGVGTRATLDSAVEARDAARAQRDQMAAQLSKARQSMADVVIRADGPGVVTERLAEPGQVINVAETVLVLARNTGREAVFHAPDGVDLTVVLGRKLHLRTMDEPVLDFFATITEFSPVADTTSGTVEVKALVDMGGPQPPLGAAVISEVQMDYPPAFIAPWSALAVLDGKPAVWVADPATMKVALKPVTISRYTNDTIQISEGLSKGDLVVGAGSNRLYPGLTVRAAGEK